MQLSLTTYLLNFIAGADSFAPGSGDLVILFDGGRLIVIVAVDVRLIHSDVLRVHFHQELWDVLPISERSCEQLRKAATNTTVCLLHGHQPRSDFSVRRKTFTARDGTIPSVQVPRETTRLTVLKHRAAETPRCEQYPTLHLFQRRK